MPARSKPDKDSPLIFMWKEKEHFRLRLLFFLVLSVAVHVFCFYLFQVTYPQKERRLPYTAQLTVLNPKDSLTQTVLRQIDDRVVSIDSAERELISGTSVEDFTPVFKPFFQSYTLQLKSPPPIYSTSPVADLVRAGSALLPPLPAIPPMGETVASAFVRHPWLSVRGEDLKDRSIVIPINWDADLGKFASSSGTETASFMIAVDGGGNVRHCLPSEGEESGVLPLLIDKIKGMRFQASNQPLQWGWIDLTW